LGLQENYGYAQDVKATELFRKAKEEVKEEEEDNKKSHLIYIYIYIYIYMRRTGHKACKSLVGKPNLDRIIWRDDTDRRVLLQWNRRKRVL
jgi:hypothetical protein